MNKQEIPEGTKCADCQKEILKGDENIGHFKKEDVYRCEGCTGKLVGTEVYSRVCGYIRPVKQWNVGAKEAFKNRKTFKVDIK